MTVVLFLSLFTAYAVVSSLITEAIKKLLSDKAKISYNLMVMIVAMIVGLVGTFVYYVLSGTEINTANVIYAILLSLASGIGSMVGYDKVKQAIEQIISAKKAKDDLAAAEEIVLEELDK